MSDRKRLSIRFATLRQWIADHPEQARRLKHLRGHFDAWDVGGRGADITSHVGFAAELNACESEASEVGYPRRAPLVVAGVAGVEARYRSRVAHVGRQLERAQRRGARGRVLRRLHLRLCSRAGFTLPAGKGGVA